MAGWLLATRYFLYRYAMGCPGVRVPLCVLWLHCAHTSITYLTGMQLQFSIAAVLKLQSSVQRPASSVQPQPQLLTTSSSSPTPPILQVKTTWVSMDPVTLPSID